MTEEIRRRSVMKSLSWRVTASSTTVFLVYVITGCVGVAFAVGLLEAVAKLAVYYVHERAWNFVSWGKKEIG